ncbi:unnamed protein product [Camellia sinensis]
MKEKQRKRKTEEHAPLSGVLSGVMVMKDKQRKRKTEEQAPLSGVMMMVFPKKNRGTSKPIIKEGQRTWCDDAADDEEEDQPYEGAPFSDPVMMLALVLLGFFGFWRWSFLGYLVLLGFAFPPQNINSAIFFQFSAVKYVYNHQIAIRRGPLRTSRHQSTCL